MQACPADRKYLSGSSSHPAIYISQYTSIDYFYHFIHKCLFPIIFSRFANYENDHLIHPRTSPFLPVPSCPLAPRIFPRRGRERNIIAPVFSSQPRDPTESFVIGRALKPRANICEFSLLPFVRAREGGISSFQRL